MLKISEFLKTWWPTGLVLAVILWLTLAPHPMGDTQIELFPGADKLVHGIMMGGLALAAMFDYRRNAGGPFRRFSPPVLILIFISTGFFSCLDEWAQGAMDLGRTSDPADLVADIIGIALFMTLGVPVLKKMFR